MHTVPMAGRYPRATFPAYLCVLFLSCHGPYSSQFRPLGVVDSIRETIMVTRGDRQARAGAWWRCSSFRFLDTGMRDVTGFDLALCSGQNAWSSLADPSPALSTLFVR